MNIKQGTLWVHVQPTGDQIPFGFDDDDYCWKPCDGAYGVFDYVHSIKERYEAIAYFDTEVFRLINDGVTAAQITLPPRLGGFVFSIHTTYEGDSE